jgi:hypothetical protein
MSMRKTSQDNAVKDLQENMAAARSNEASDALNVLSGNDTMHESSIGQNLGEEAQRLNGKREPPIVKGCFIATAAMNSELHPHVQLLRHFRDEFLLKSKYKVTFENLLDRYYRISPPIANKMNEHGFLKLVLRYSLVYPIVFGIKGILPIIDIILGIKKDAKTNQTG